MSHSSGITSSSSLKNLITSTAQLPLAIAMGKLFTHTATVFEYATYENPQSRFTAVMVATMITALGIWGIQLTLGNVPFHCVRKIFVPIAEWTLKVGLAWVILKALDAAVKEMNDNPTTKVQRTDPLARTKTY